MIQTSTFEIRKGKNDFAIVKSANPSILLLFVTSNASMCTRFHKITRKGKSNHPFFFYLNCVLQAQDYTITQTKIITLFWILLSPFYFIIWLLSSQSILAKMSPMGLTWLFPRKSRSIKIEPWFNIYGSIYLLNFT